MRRVYAGQSPESYGPVTLRLRLNGHSTSIRLERSFWRILDGMVEREGMTTPAFVSRPYDQVQELRGGSRNFASLLRCACLIQAGQAVEPRLRHGRRVASRRTSVAAGYYHRLPEGL